MSTLVKKIAVAAAALSVSMGAALADPYAPYKGTTVVANFPAHPHYHAVMKVLPQFTKETGIRVEVDLLQYL